MKKRIVLLLFCSIMLLLFGCSNEQIPSNTQLPSNTQPVYIGTWHATETGANSATVVIGETSIQMNLNGYTLETGSYKVSAREGYTYVQAEFEGTTIVFVLVNQDMLCICTAAELEGTTIVSATGYATLFNAEVDPGFVLFRAGSSSAQWPLNMDIADFELNADGIGNYTSFAYYPNASTLLLFADNGYHMYYMTDPNTVIYVETLALANAGGLPTDCIPTQHGFVITDHK